MYYQNINYLFSTEQMASFRTCGVTMESGKP